MKYYFILTDSRDAWMQFVYLPTGDYVSGYIRDFDRQQGRMDAVRLPPYGRLCVRLYP